jgi:exopolyphosphatase/guanosine-5'-triphosphate,3'-diphosphate pyrophosphatase
VAGERPRAAGGGPVGLASAGAEPAPCSDFGADTGGGATRTQLSERGGDELQLQVRTRGGARSERERCLCGPPCPQRLAVLDLGSTSFNLLVADVCAGGRIEPVLRRREQLELGRWIASPRKLPGRVRDAALRSSAALIGLAREQGSQRVLAVGTAALRDAAGGAELSAELASALELPVRVLSGVEEACTLFCALRQRHGADELCLAIDLGGGSLELARGCAAGVEAALSLPLGVVHLRSALELPDPLGASDEQRLRRHVRERLERSGAAAIARDAREVLASGGALRALLRIAAAEGAAPRGGRFAVERLQALCASLARAPRAARERRPGMNPRRVDSIATAAVITSELVRALDLRSFTVSDWGLREGVLLEAARGHR